VTPCCLCCPFAALRTASFLGAGHLPKDMSLRNHSKKAQRCRRPLEVGSGRRVPPPGITRARPGRSVWRAPSRPGGSGSG
jgi:hypothetical protein